MYTLCAHSVNRETNLLNENKNASYKSLNHFNFSKLLLCRVLKTKFNTFKLKVEMY